MTDTPIPTRPLDSTTQRPLFVAPHEHERPSTVDVVFDSAGRICYLDEHPEDRSADGVLIRRWDGDPTGVPLWGQHHPLRQFHVMDNPIRCAGCAGAPDVDERGTLWLLPTDPGTSHMELAGDILTATPPVCLNDARKAAHGCDVLREAAVALRVTEADIVGVRGTVYFRDGSPPAPDEVVLFDDPAIERVVAGQLLRRISRYEIDETTLPKLRSGPVPGRFGVPSRSTS